MSKPQIKLSKQTKGRLEHYKEDNGHTSYDSAIRELLYKTEMRDHTT